MGKNKRNKQQQQQQHKNAQQPTAAGPTATTTNNAEAAKGNRIPSLNNKKRKALNLVIQAILDVVEIQPASANDEWKQYAELQPLLERLIEQEKPLQLAVCPAEDAANADEQTRLAKVAAFNEWARAGGVQTDCVEITTFPGYQLGLRVTRDLAEGEQVLSVPRQLIFSEELLPEAQRKLFIDFPTHLNVTYMLIIEKVRGAASNWQPFIDTLPTRYNTVLYFTVEQMQRLRGTSACSAAVRHCRVIARIYASMYKCAYMQPDDSVMAGMSNLFTEYGLCYELYRWAVSTVTTRQNLVPRQLATDSDVVRCSGFEMNPMSEKGVRNSPMSALIPYWDMANHRCGKITSYYKPAAHQMECIAQEAFKAGEQFFIYYGDRCNADRLVHHGFLDMNNPKDYVHVRLGLSPTDALAEQRALLLSELNIERKAELRVLPAPEHISGELLAFVRVFNMSKEQLEHWCSDLERAVDLLHIDCALETDLETRTWQYLYQRLKLLLGVLDATLKEADEQQQLEALQQQPAPSEIDIMVLQYRLLERRILGDALQYAQERLKV
ncbi:actin-histidine N-methyltransferase [Drosophila novamexicana]|uniref:actin-histidine N-methyltransferase n=1 Tax=Drosophila novamexicana TaxID=47314 RepID=UPI0011E5892B|nr:actin-histidine N-methyltransferase [Drosophila novamexicana]